VTHGRYDAVIVGAGHNGLVCGFYLARAGLRVGVFERSREIGGACVTERLLGRGRFSTCANMLWGLQQRVVDDMELGRHGFRYRQVDPVALHLYRDGSWLHTWRDPRRTAAEVARLSSRWRERSTSRLPSSPPPRTRSERC
jgi:phytoene dehydrogenase-like protein